MLTECQEKLTLALIYNGLFTGQCEHLSSSIIGTKPVLPDVGSTSRFLSHKVSTREKHITRKPCGYSKLFEARASEFLQLPSAKNMRF